MEGGFFRVRGGCGFPGFSPLNLPFRIVQTVHRFPVCPGLQVPVYVHGDLDGRVPHLLLDVGQRFPVGEKGRREGVSEVMESQPAQSRLRQNPPVRLYYRGRFQFASLGVDEDPLWHGASLRQGLLGHRPSMVSKDRRQPVAQVDPPRLAALRCSDLALGDSPPHLDEFPVPVDVLPLESDQLPHAHPRP